MRRIVAAGLVAMLALTACGGGSSTTEGSASPSTDDLSYDVSGVAKVDDIAAMLPDAIAEKGTLIVGASTDYAPAEFRADDLKTGP